MKRELPRLVTVLDGTRKSYGSSHPELSDIRDIFRNLAMELGIHVANDQRLIFPLCRRMDTHAGEPPREPMEVRVLVAVMEKGNEYAAQALRKIRELTGSYASPLDAGGSYKFMLQALKAVEVDMHLHIHEENNVLFPILLRPVEETVR